MERLKENLGIRKVISVIFLGLAICCFSATAYALHYDLGNEFTLDCDILLKYSAQIRAAGQDSNFLQDANVDDGDRNFDRWQMTQNKFSTLIDIDLKRDNLGFFLRPRAYYDFAYMTNNNNDSPATINKFGNRSSFDGKTQDLHGQKAEILDAFAYGSFDLWGHDMTLRVGRQAVSWGTSVFLNNSIATAMSPYDITQFHSPGTELKEVVLPLGQVYTAVEITPNLALAAYYQWEWDPNRFDESGAFFNVADFLWDAGDLLVLAPGPVGFPKAHIRHADNDGQYGFRLTYRIPQLLSSEVGLYFINYHDHAGMVHVGQLVGVAPAVVVDYAEDIKLYGFSFNTQIGPASYGLEVSYRRDFPVAIVGGYDKADVLQAELAFIWVTPPGPFYDDILILAEAGYNRVDNYSGTLTTNGNSYAHPADDNAFGGTVSAQFEFFDITRGLIDLNMYVPIAYTFNPEGVSPVPGTFAEGADSYSIGLNFLYKQLYKIDLGYTGYLGCAGNNPVIDRDYISLNLSVTF